MCAPGATTDVHRQARARLHGQRAAHDSRDAQLLRRLRRHSPYPASLCTSVNHVVCHGIPGEKKLKDGDIVNVDVTVIKDGYHGDTSRMFMVGEAVDPGTATRRSDLRGDVARHPRDQARRAPRATSRRDDPALRGRTRLFRVVREFCGHGIGKQFHEEPAGAPTTRPSWHRAQAAGRHDLHRRADDQRGPGRHPLPRRRLDHRHGRSFALGPMGAHRAFRRPTWLRDPDAVGRDRRHRPAHRKMSASAAVLPDAAAPSSRIAAWRDEWRRERLAIRNAFFARPGHAFAASRAREARRSHRHRPCGGTSASTGEVTRRWSPPGATAAASCSLTRTWTCWCCSPTRRIEDGRDADVERFIAALWDIGLELAGHAAVRTVAQCRSEMEGRRHGARQPFSKQPAISPARGGLCTGFVRLVAAAAMDPRAFFRRQGARAAAASPQVSRRRARSTTSSPT